MLLVDVRGDRDDSVEGVVHPVGLGQLVLDEGGQMFPILDQLVIIAEPGPAHVLFE